MDDTSRPWEKLAVSRANLIEAILGAIGIPDPSIVPYDSADFASNIEHFVGQTLQSRHPARKVWEPLVPEYAEVRAWYSPTEGFFTQHYHYDHRVEAVTPTLVRVADGVRVGGLPADTLRMTTGPTQWAYDRACDALHKERRRADDLEGSKLELQERITQTIGGYWIRGIAPLDVGVDALIHLVRMHESDRSDG